MPETVPLGFTEDDETWVALKLYVDAGLLRSDMIDLSNWIIYLGCASEELRIIIVNLDDCMVNSSPPWTTYRALMTCRLVALDKNPGEC